MINLKMVKTQQR